MNHTKASCGHLVIAEGAPNSSARRAQERRTCELPRCKSGLPKKFTDRECAAYVWLHGRGIRPWVVDLLNKSVCNGRGEMFVSLVEFALHHGWEG